MSSALTGRQPVPEPSEGEHSFEALYRALVDKERAGFEQCRDKVAEWLRAQVTAIELTTGHYSQYDCGQLDAYRKLLAFLLKGQQPRAGEGGKT
jgi:hypothetical protein